jgi:hypothetical protein
VALVAITYFGFKQEEITDSKKLADLYNRIKDERIAQLNHTRMSLKLKAMNQGRAKTDMDRQFLRNYNMLRIQSLALMQASENDQDIDTLSENVDRILICLNETVFGNASFMKRLFTQTVDPKKVCTADYLNNPANKA